MSVSDGRGRPVRDGGLGRWLAAVAPARAHGEVGIALIADASVRALNRRYRRKDTPTDVLSFPSDAEQRVSRTVRGDVLEPDRTGPPHDYLGDIVIGTDTARRQARDAGHSYQTELRVLALHGLLHLLGYDHESRSDAGRMRRLETRLRRRGGLKAGLVERAHA